MASTTPSFVEDFEILWVAVPLRGNPPNWTPGTNYKIGDTVIPSTNFSVPAGSENIMFQCVGFVGYSGSSAPAFPTSVGIKVLDGDIEWTSRDPSQDPAQPSNLEYYHIKQNITVSSS